MVNKRRNITLTLPKRTMAILDNLYEAGVVNSRTQVIEFALFEWLRKNRFFEDDK